MLQISTSVFRFMVGEVSVDCIRYTVQERDVGSVIEEKTPSEDTHC